MKYMELFLVILAWIIYIVSVFGSIVLGQNMAVGYDDFNFGIFLVSLISGLLLGTLVRAAVKHLENQDRIIDRLNQIKLEISQIKTDEKSDEEK